MAKPLSRRARTRDALVLCDAGIPGRPHQPDQAYRHGDGGALLAAGLAREDGDHIGCSFWWSCVAGDWSRRLRRGGTRVRTSLPSTARALRDAGGDAPDLLAHVAWRTGRRASFRGEALPHRAPAQPPAEPHAATSADSDCRQWRAKDTPPGRTLPPPPQSPPWAGDPAEAGDPPPALCGPWPRI